MKLSKQAIIFRGGGYDGCFWEWNAIYFNGDTLELLEDQPDISGRDGKAMLDIARKKGVVAVLKQAWSEQTEFERKRRELRPTTIRLESHHKRLQEFAVPVALGVAKKLEMTLQCESCGDHFPVAELLPGRYRSSGGCVISATSKRCQDCSDEEAEKMFSEYWRSCSVADRVELIDASTAEVSVFSARREDPPMDVSDVEHILDLD